MRLSTKGRYGLEAMLDISIHRSEGQINLKSISERLGISENYLEQLFMALRKAGLVKSIRGSQGGYILAREPENITIGSILRTLEGSLAPVSCVNEDATASCIRSNECVTKIVWAKIRDEINQVVDFITLEYLTDEYRKTNNKEDRVYYI